MLSEHAQTNCASVLVLKFRLANKKTPLRFKLLQNTFWKRSSLDPRCQAKSDQHPQQASQSICLHVPAKSSAKMARTTKTAAVVPIFANWMLNSQAELPPWSRLEEVNPCLHSGNRLRSAWRAKAGQAGRGPGGWGVNCHGAVAGRTQPTQLARRPRADTTPEVRIAQTQTHQSTFSRKNNFPFKVMWYFSIMPDKSLNNILISVNMVKMLDNFIY